jgi:S1-C subfamily serine protease
MTFPIAPKARVACVLGLIALANSSPAWAFKVAPPIGVHPVPPGTPVRAIAFTKLYNTVGTDQVVGVISTGPLYCAPYRKMYSGFAAGELTDPAFRGIFNFDLKRAGFLPVGEASALFSNELANEPTDLEIGGEIESVRLDVCFPHADPYDNASTLGASKGTIEVSIRWEVFSRSERKVLAHLRTTGGFDLDKAEPNGLSRLWNAAFSQNVHALMDSREFRAVVLTTEPAAPKSGQAIRTTATLTLTRPPTKLTAADSIGSVVTVFAGDGFGSGFVLGDGYILTNYHVTGNVGTVRIRWPDGLEFAGEVVRSDKRRDVALIKTDTRGRPVLGLRTGPVQPGEVVLAIGTPLDPKFQSTMTRGVVSALRTFGGFAYIQSDVMVNHGNSGGPLLDEKGQVVGLTVAGYQPDGAPAGINLFIPIRDAMDFLALSVAPTG